MMVLNMPSRTETKGGAVKRYFKLSFCLLLLTAANAHGATAYVGGSLGSIAALDAKTNVRDLQAVLASVNASSVVSYDKTSPGLSLGGGIEINRYLAAEVSIVYLGTYKLSATATSGFTTVGANETDRVSGVSIAAIGKFPIYHRIKVIGKIGLAETSIKESCSVSNVACLSQTDTGLNAVYGAGVSMRPVDALEIRLDYTVYPGVGNTGNDYTAGTFGMVETSLFYHY